MIEHSKADKVLGQDDRVDTVLQSHKMRCNQQLDDIVRGQANVSEMTESSWQMVQAILLDLGYTVGAGGSSGKMCSETQAAIMDFQSHFTPTNRTHKHYDMISSAGEFTANTLLGLDEALLCQWHRQGFTHASQILKSDSLYSVEVLHAVAKGEAKASAITKEGRVAVPHSLIQLGYDLGASGADGEFGSKTKSAVTQFQQQYTPSHQTHEVYDISIVEPGLIKTLQKLRAIK